MKKTFWRRFSFLSLSLSHFTLLSTQIPKTLQNKTGPLPGTIADHIYLRCSFGVRRDRSAAPPARLPFLARKDQVRQSRGRLGFGRRRRRRGPEPPLGQGDHRWSCFTESAGRDGPGRGAGAGRGEVGRDLERSARAGGRRAVGKRRRRKGRRKGRGGAGCCFCL